MSESESESEFTENRGVSVSGLVTAPQMDQSLDFDQVPPKPSFCFSYVYLCDTFRRGTSWSSSGVLELQFRN